VQLTSSTGHFVAQRTASIHRAKCTSYNLTDTSHLSGTVTADSAQGAYIFFVNFCSYDQENTRLHTTG
jgi:hypothetical protein